MMDLVIRVKEIKGRCPVYEENDSFRLIAGHKLVSEKPLCMHSLAALLPHYNALAISPPERWGLAGTDDINKAYVQCLDPYDYTDGGTAIFEISREESQESAHQ
jgi:uncharacterized repeat protein (TIGR04076 family)